MERDRLVWMVFVGICFTVACGQRCEPSCVGHNVGDLVANPRNCTQYYKCMPGGLTSDAPIDCNPGMIFDSVAGGCKPGNTCEHICPPCHLTCVSIGDHIADPFDCSVFYVCDVNGPGPAQSCPTDRPHFDGISCISDKSVCCNPGCIPQCEQESVIQVPDPLDCTRYYMCVGSNPQDRQTCVTGVFDYSIGHCSSSAECKILCSSPPIDPNSSTTTTTTTTTTPSPSNCTVSLTCTAAGLFPVCPYCDPLYFQCDAAGQQGIMQTCTDNLVFNPEPSYPYCVLPSNCPYTP